LPELKPRLIRHPSARRERGLESRLVWIFGSPRSGSTWLLRLLCHPLAPADAAPTGVERLEAPEADRPSAIPLNEPYSQHHLTPALALDLDGDGPLELTTLHAFRHDTPNYLLSDRYEAGWREPLRRLVLGRLLVQVDEITQRHGARGDGPVVIKEPNGSVGADFIMSLLPRSRMIFLLRDGRDVVDSMLDAQLPGGWLASAEAIDAGELRARRMHLIRRESRLWVARTQAVRRAFAAHPEPRRHLVRYEDALADSAAALRELDAWLGLGRTPGGHADALRWNDFGQMPAEAKGRGKPLRAARPGLWRENLSPEEQEAMASIMGAELAAAGYA
jgi:hypothetical protein